MFKKAIEVIVTIRKKGLLEFMVYGLRLVFNKLFSFIKIFFLRLRGYDIDYSVTLRGGIFFFQSTKNSISINGGSIGNGIRISTGGNGIISMGKGILVDDFTFIMAHEKIEIGDNTKIASFCFITDFNHKFTNKNKNLVEQGYDTKPVMIGRNVWIGTHSVVLPGVSIGDRSVIGAGSIVTKDIPSNSIAVGNPAKVIKKF